jgi:hypothetical protein
MIRKWIPRSADQVMKVFGVGESMCAWAGVLERHSVCCLVFHASLIEAQCFSYSCRNFRIICASVTQFLKVSHAFVFRQKKSTGSLRCSSFSSARTVRQRQVKSSQLL